MTTKTTDHLSITGHATTMRLKAMRVFHAQPCNHSNCFPTNMEAPTVEMKVINLKGHYTNELKIFKNREWNRNKKKK